MKKGLILEGGAMRGLFTAGVIDVFMENGIHFDGMAGVSAGAAFGCNLKSHQIGRVLRYNKKLCHDWRYCSIRSWIKTGDLYGGEFDYHTLPDEIDVMDKKTYDEDPMDFYAVVTNAETGRAEYPDLKVLDYESLEWMRASASMPVASRPVEMRGKKYLDGGISDSIPLHFMEEKGYDRIVIVLTQPDGYVKKPQAGMGILRILLKDYPEIARDLALRHEAYNMILDEISRKERQGKIFVIRPEEKLKLGKTEHDPDKLEEAYKIGVKDGLKALEPMKEYLFR